MCNLLSGIRWHPHHNFGGQFWTHAKVHVSFHKLRCWSILERKMSKDMHDTQCCSVFGGSTKEKRVFQLRHQLCGDGWTLTVDRSCTDGIAKHTHNTNTIQVQIQNLWTSVIVNLRYKTSTKSQLVHNKAHTHILQIQIHSRCDCEAHTQPFHPILPQAPDCCTEHTILLVHKKCVLRTNMGTHAWCSEHTNMSTHVSWMHTNSIYRQTNILIHSCIYTITTLLVMINIMAFFHIEQTSLMLENFGGYFKICCFYKCFSILKTSGNSKAYHFVMKEHSLATFLLLKIACISKFF